MPPPGGPLIGSGMKSMIAEAAIVADMEHRGFGHYGDGVFKLPGTNGNDFDPVVWNVVVQDGSVEVDMIYGSSSADEVPEVSDFAHLQTEVFDYWPGAIDDAFANWEDMSEASMLDWDAAGILRGAAEVRVTASNDASTGESNGANVRLDADLTNLTTRTAELNGAYAEAFNENYVARMRPVLDNLHSMTMVLAYGLAGEHELFQRTREQIAQLALDAKAAMEASGPRSSGDTTGIKIALIVVGAVCAGVSAAATGGASIPVAVKVAAALTGAGASATGGLLGALVTPPTAPEPIPLGAPHPKDVLANLVDGLDEINTRIRAEEQLLVDLFDQAHSDLAPAAAQGPFNIARPEILDHGGSSVLESQQTILVDPTTIAKITELWIPSIIGDIEACRAELDSDAYSWTRPDGIGLSATGPWSSYSALQSGVIALLGDTSAELDGAAGSLQAAAADIGLSDEGVNATFATQAQQITEENINY